ncbi:MAG: LysM peptidoglycan-binding domain-containing protein, partial [Chloroflexi bacterium]|nr:LysM peptidoglycan-binding domain-containing protein [Chloroflexota bacterium]
LYRGSLLVLLIGTAVALWLLVRPPGSGDGTEVVIPGFTPTAVVSEGDATPSPEATSETPAAESTRTPGAGRTRTPQATATTEQRVYVVQTNDSLTAIGERFAPPGVDPFQYAIAIAEASGLASIDEQIFPGQVLVLP